MINDVLLINENYLKSVTAVGDNVDSKYLTPSIMKAQIQGLLPLIGEKLYDKLCTLVKLGQNDPITGINDPNMTQYKTLLDVYVASYLVQKAQAELQFNLYAKQRNEGVVAYSDLNANQVGVADVKFIINQFNQDAEFYGKRMVDWLIQNHLQFPEFTACEKGKMKADISRSEFCKITL